MDINESPTLKTLSGVFSGRSGDDAEYRTCEVCNGYGRLGCPKCVGRRKEHVALLFFRVTLPCTLCVQTGLISCVPCNGSGRVPAEVTEPKPKFSREVLKEVARWNVFANLRPPLAERAPLLSWLTLPKMRDEFGQECEDWEPPMPELDEKTGRPKKLLNLAKYPVYRMKPPWKKRQPSQRESTEAYELELESPL